MKSEKLGNEQNRIILKEYFPLCLNFMLGEKLAADEFIFFEAVTKFIAYKLEQTQKEEDLLKTIQMQVKI